MRLIAGVFILFIIGCATYQHKVNAARDLIESHQYNESLKLLEPLAKTPSDDQLIYLLDYAVAAQLADNTKESTDAFLKADKLSEELDYHSVSRVGGSLVLSEEMVQYKGDSFEKMFINAYLAMNFLSEHKFDEAMVEVRRINEKYQKNRLDQKKSFEQNFFSKFLSALIWESQGKYDDAYIDYEICYTIDPNSPALPTALIRSSKLARRPEAYKKWKNLFPSVVENPDWYNSKKGELLIIYQQGWGPRKTPDPLEPRFPILRPQPSRTQFSKLFLQKNDQPSTPLIQAESQLIYDVESVAIHTLRDDALALMGRRMGGLATKAIVADQIRQKNKDLGELTWILLNIADRADLRQWSTLPQTLQVIRVPLDAGKYHYMLQGLDFYKEPTGEKKEGEIQIRKGEKSFLIWRSLE